MPTPRPFQAVSLAPKCKRRGRPPKRAAKAVLYRKPQPTATVSQETRDRLIAEALQHPAYEGMEPSEVAAFINSKLDALIAPYPYWYGHLAKDRPKKPATDAQLKALEKARQRKIEIQAEADAPYVPSQEQGE